MATIIDVAKLANVSKQTVSRVINGSFSVNENTKNKVLAAIKELDYHPNFMARVLKSNKSKSIGFIISDPNNIFYIKIADKLQNLLNVDGYSLFILFSDEKTKNLEKGIEYMLEKCVETILFTPTADSLTIKDRMLNLDVNCIQLFRNVIPNVPSIIIDDEYGAFLATEELIKQGHTNILMLVGPHETLHKRRIGFKNCLEKYGLPYDEQNYVVLNGIDKEQRQQIIDSIKSTRPTAIIPVSGPVQYLTISALDLMNISFPNEIKLLFYDFNELADLFDITTIEHNIDEICEIIKQEIKEPTKEDIIINPYLNRR